MPERNLQLTPWRLRSAKIDQSLIVTFISIHFAKRGSRKRDFESRILNIYLDFYLHICLLQVRSGFYLVCFWHTSFTRKRRRVPVLFVHGGREVGAQSDIQNKWLKKQNVRNIM